MPLYALVDGHPERVREDGPSHAECRECGWGMIACRGSKVPPYWRHKPANPNPDCEAGRESEWHLAWKALALDDTQEIRRANRIADVLAPGGYAVEFQAWAMDRAEVRGRENDWSTQGGIVWIFKAIDETAKKQIAEAGPLWRGRRILQQPLEWHSSPWKDQQAIEWKDQQAIEVSWLRAPERVRWARAPAFLDLGDDRLLFVGGWWLDRPGPLTGYAWPVSKQWVIDNVLKGDKIPEPFGEDPEVVRARKAREAEERRRADRLRRLAEQAAERERAEAEARREAERERELREAIEYRDWLEVFLRYCAASENAQDCVTSWFRWWSWLVRGRYRPRR
jgi:hypothetical protein